MLLTFWSPKGGSGTSVVAAASSILLGRAGEARLADLAGDQSALLGLASEAGTGLTDWLAAGPDAPAEALDRIAVDVGPGLRLLPFGGRDTTGAVPESGAALGVLLRDGPGPTVADVGSATAPAARALLDVADVSVVVVRGCYLALRRAVRSEPLARAAGVVLVDEPGRSLGSREVSDVLGVPLLATVPVRASVARAVDAGVLVPRLPAALGRPLLGMLDRLDVAGGTGRAA